MLCYGSEFVPEKYKDYRNRTLTKHEDILKNQLRRISECSLKPEDKIALKKKMIELITNL